MVIFRANPLAAFGFAHPFFCLYQPAVLFFRFFRPFPCDLVFFLPLCGEKPGSNFLRPPSFPVSDSPRSANKRLIRGQVLLASYLKFRAKTIRELKYNKVPSRSIQPSRCVKNYLWFFQCLRPRLLLGHSFVFCFLDKLRLWIPYSITLEIDCARQLHIRSVFFATSDWFAVPRL